MALTQGASRVAYHGLAFIESDWMPIVLKTFKEMKEVNDFECFYHQMEVSNVASVFACEYNRFAGLSGGDRITVLLSHIIECDLRRCVGSKYKSPPKESNQILYSSERYLPDGIFVKFTNNVR